MTEKNGTLIKCVLASGNQGKLAELSGTLKIHGIELVSQSEFNVTEADENASTFIENALIKARHASVFTGHCALADDSGLVVPALNGEPGIYSARYAATPSSNAKPSDQDNIDKLLRALSTMPEEARAAYFVCALVLLRYADDPEPVIATGLWHGRILPSAEDEGGFGYDPVFYCPKQGMSAAAMGKSVKSQVSHRAIALVELKQKLAQYTPWQLNPASNP